MLPEKQKKTYEAFYDSTVDNDILDDKTTVMLQLASSFCLRFYSYTKNTSF